MFDFTALCTELGGLRADTGSNLVRERAHAMDCIRFPDTSVHCLEDTLHVSTHYLTCPEQSDGLPQQRNDQLESDGNERRGD